ncbi:haloalkane dehalogenase [Lentzea sp. NBRC 105346]|uniref:alpha/beta fold hydrolase n=1 Tax=Lentzea sp. NBRC 105346 TaxID=3032205 RepID=UPI0024A07FB6|nr:alpha/beta hydrolase [Lentzea sp. NBRC 105346]GLZ33599.1 haloalkane dehalogenase [Lentzea sp. NBRC 105346]
MIEQLSIPTDAGTFDAIASGPEDGRPVLLLHGFPEAAIAFEHQVGVLGANGYRAVAFDQRGYSPGVRPEHPSEYAVSELVDDVLRVADQLGFTTFDIVGHDWGGAVAWWTAIDHSERLSTLTAISTPHPGALKTALQTDEDQQLRSRYMTEWREKSTERRMLENNAHAIRQMFEWRVRPSHVEEYVQRLQEPGALTAALNWYRGGKPSGVADKVTVKTMYIWSTEDVAFGSTAAFETEKWVVGPYRFEMLEDVTHWIPEEVPEACSALILENLA